MSGKILSRGRMLLPVPLTDAELQERGAALAKNLSDMGQVEHELDSVKSSFKARLTALEADRAELTVAINTRREMRSVDIEVVPSYEVGVARTIRLDNGEIVSSRPLTDSERQLEIKIPPPPIEDAAVPLATLGEPGRAGAMPAAEEVQL